jgi:hypothetical protein
MSQHGFLAAYGQVFRTLSALPGTTSENALKVFELHQRYGREITEVADRQIRMNAGVENALNLPSTALVVLAGAPSGVELAERDPFESEPPASAQAASDRRPVPDLRFRFAVHESRKKIAFLEGPELKGANYRFVRELAQQFRADWNAEKDRSSYGYVPTKTLMSKLTLSEHSIGQTAARVRKALRNQFLDAIDYLIDEEDIIQSARWRGYRLNPFLIMVPASRAECHDSNPNVMTRLVGH